MHDIGLRKCAIVPLIISGSSEIPLKEIKYCKITDIVPTLLKVLGKNPHNNQAVMSLIYAVMATDEMKKDYPKRVVSIKKS